MFGCKQNQIRLSTQEENDNRKNNILFIFVCLIMLVPLMISITTIIHMIYEPLPQEKIEDTIVTNDRITKEINTAFNSYGGSYDMLSDNGTKILMTTGYLEENDRKTYVDAAADEKGEIYLISYTLRLDPNLSEKDKIKKANSDYKKLNEIIQTTNIREELKTFYPLPKQITDTIDTPENIDISISTESDPVDGENNRIKIRVCTKE